jgi:3-phosphoshikimate 1-carboxyvinyltransferase
VFDVVAPGAIHVRFRIQQGKLSGEVLIPGSKSHTIRGLILGLLACGRSRLLRPLASDDTQSCVAFCRALGGRVDTDDTACWTVEGTAGHPVAPPEPVDVGNSGTTLYLGMGVAALCRGPVQLTGDNQTRRRPAGPLLEALAALGATARSLAGNGCAPLVVGGGLKGGSVSIECPTSQYMSSLLICCPLASGDCDITATLLNEKPYVRMTCRWLDELGVRYHASQDMQRFRLPGGQCWQGFEKAIPADFSSATFFFVAAAITGSELLLRGLDMSDTQGDKAVVDMLQQMGCHVETEHDGLRIRGPKRLKGGIFDLNATPDALPAMAVAGAVAEGETRLLNVPQARLKETDRIAGMAEELRKMGAHVEELPDGLVIRGGRLKGATVDGRGDHRIIMALTVAGLAASGETTVSTAERAAITFPQFRQLMLNAGARLAVQEDV